MASILCKSLLFVPCLYIASLPFRNVVNQFGGQALWRELLAGLHGVADKHTVTIANVALAWVMQQSSKRLVHPIVGEPSS